jgi:hypothetical protein
MGTNSIVYLADFYLYSYEFDFLKHLFKTNTYPVFALEIASCS